MSRNPRDANPSANAAFRDLATARLSRRGWLAGAAALSLVGALPACATGRPGTAPALTFTPIGPSADDALRVPPEYEATVLFRWGDPVGRGTGMPEFRFDASNSAADQALQAGMHHDGMHFFPLPSGSGGAPRGLLAMNHEYLDEGLLFPDGQKTWSAEKVLKAQHAVGVSVVEVEERDGAWRVIRPSRYARRITARTPCRSRGPRPAMRSCGPPPIPRAPGARHVQRVRARLDAVGHLSHVRGELAFPFRRIAAPIPGRPAAVPHHRHRAPVSLGGVRRALRRRRASERAEPLRLGGGDRSARSAAPPVKRTALGRMAHEGAAARSGRSAAGVLHGRRLGVRVRLQVRHGAALGSRPPRGQSRSARRRACSTSRASMPTAAATGCPSCMGRGRSPPPTASADQGAVLVRTRQAADLSARPRWTAPSGSCRIP